jgi:Sulfatase
MNDKTQVPSNMTDLGRPWLGMLVVAIHSIKISLVCQYVSGLHFSPYALTLNLLLTLPLCFLFFWLVGRSRCILVIYCLLHYLILCVLITYREYAGSFLTLDAITSTWREALLLTPGKSFPIPTMAAWSFVDLPFMMAIIWLRFSLRTGGRIKWAVVGGCVGLAILSHGVFQGYVFQGLKRDSGSVVRLQGIMPAYIMEIGSWFGMGPGFRVPPVKSLVYNGRPPVKNIVVIQVESLDSHVIRTMHGGQPVMPFLHQLSKNSLYYPYCLSYHYIGGSSDCDFSILTGIEPSTSSVSMKMISAELIKNSIPGHLRKTGYRYSIYNGYVGGLFGRGSSYAKMGVQFYGSDTMGLPIIVGNPDSRIFDKYLDERRTYQDKPSVSHIITVTSHTPFDFVYSLDGEAKTWFKSISDSRVRDYFSSMKYTDECIRRVFSHFDMSSTVVVLVGDHPPAVPFSRRQYDSAERASWFDSSFIDENGRLLEFTSVMIVGAGISPELRTSVATFPDIAATILDLSGFVGDFATNGRSLVASVASKDLTTVREISFKGAVFNSEKMQAMITKYGATVQVLPAETSIQSP